MSAVKNGYVQIEVPPVQTVSDGGIIIPGSVPKAVKAKVLDAGTCNFVTNGCYISVPSHLVKPINGDYYINEEYIDGIYGE